MINIMFFTLFIVCKVFICR